jgi:hypothetical protein
MGKNHMVVTDQAVGTMESDAAAIKKAIGVLFRPGDVVELRVVGSPAYGTISGYYDDFDKLAEDVAICGDDENVATVYWTLNPVDPSLLARSPNRFKMASRLSKGEKLPTTRDEQIVERRLLLIDCDPVREKDAVTKEKPMATPEQKRASLVKAQALYDYLQSLGWPEPLGADSGNGAHIVYGIDLPNDHESTELIAGCLAVLAAKFDDDAVKIDRVVFNAARICKAYGTPVRKSLPHCLSKIKFAPNVLVPVPKEKLRELYDSMPEVRVDARHAPGNDGSSPTMHDDFNLGGFLDHVCEACNVSLLEDYESNGVHYYPLDGCPNNDGAEHTNQTVRKSCITMGEFGLGYKCFADQCEGFGIVRLLEKMRGDDRPFEGKIWKDDDGDLRDVEDINDVEDIESLRQPVGAREPFDEPPFTASVDEPMPDPEWERIKKEKQRIAAIDAEADAAIERVNAMIAEMPAESEAEREAKDEDNEAEREPKAEPAGDYASLLKAACYADGEAHRIGRQALESGKPLGWMLAAQTAAYAASGSGGVRMMNEAMRPFGHGAMYILLLGASESGKTQAMFHAIGLAGLKDDSLLKTPPVSDNSILLDLAGTAKKPVSQRARLYFLKEILTLLLKAAMEYATTLPTLCDLFDDGIHGGKTLKEMRIPPLAGFPVSILGGLPVDNPADFAIQFPPGSEDGFWGRCLFAAAERGWAYKPLPGESPRLEMPMVVVPDIFVDEATQWKNALPDKKASYRLGEILIRVAANWESADKAGLTVYGEAFDMPDVGPIEPVISRPEKRVVLSRGIFEAAKSFMTAMYEMRKLFKPGAGRVEDALIANSIVESVKKCMKKNGGEPISARAVFRAMPLREKWGYSRVMREINAADQAGAVRFTDPKAKAKTAEHKAFGQRAVWLPELLGEAAKARVKEKKNGKKRES